MTILFIAIMIDLFTSSIGSLPSAALSAALRRFDNGGATSSSSLSSSKYTSALWNYSTAIISLHMQITHKCTCIVHVYNTQVQCKVFYSLVLRVPKFL